MAEADPLTYCPDVKLLLIGKTGNGKSSTGNTILSETQEEFSEETFEAEASSVSVTATVKKVNKNLYGKNITVVDTPGVCDTEKDNDTILSEIAMAVQKCPDGYDAFVIVMRYPTRLTDEELKALQQLEQLFGKEMYDFTICVFTNGSTFHSIQAKNRKQNKTVLSFEEEIYKDERSNSKGALGPVLKKFKGGVVLFDNLEKDPTKRSAMVQELLKKVMKLKTDNQSKCYDNKIFHIVREERKKVAKQLGVSLKDKKEHNEIERKAQKEIEKKLVKKRGCTIL